MSWTQRSGRWVGGAQHSLAGKRRLIAAHSDVAALLVILALGAALRLAFSPRAPVFVHGDSYQYFRPAAALLYGEGFPLPLKRPPLYPAFIAVVGWSVG